MSRTTVNEEAKGRRGYSRNELAKEKEGKKRITWHRKELYAQNEKRGEQKREERREGDGTRNVLQPVERRDALVEILRW